MNTTLEKFGRYLAVTANCFGRGATADEAIRKMKAAGGKTLLVHVYHFEDPRITTAYVDDMGSVTWEWNGEDKPTQPITKVVMRKGKIESTATIDPV